MLHSVLLQPDDRIFEHDEKASQGTNTLAYLSSTTMKKSFITLAPVEETVPFDAEIRKTDMVEGPLKSKSAMLNLNKNISHQND